MSLEAKGICYRYSSRASWLLHNIDLHIAAGEIVGLYGESGCGKSTLAKLLAGYMKPEQGSVEWQGEPLPERGYCPVQWIAQHPEQSVNPRWTIRQIITEAYEPDKALLARLQIRQAWMDRWPNECSAGELQRCCIARALGSQTKLIIADEMTAMLDAVTQAHIWHTVVSIVRERQLAMLVISHDHVLVNQLSDRVVTWQRLTRE